MTSSYRAGAQQNQAAGIQRGGIKLRINDMISPAAARVDAFGATLELPIAEMIASVESSR